MVKLPTGDCLLFMNSELATLFIPERWQEDQVLRLLHLFVAEGGGEIKRERERPSWSTTDRYFIKSSHGNSTNTKEQCRSTYLDNSTPFGTSKWL